MKDLNYIKLFEEYSDDENEEEYISEEDLLFTITEDDIDDYLIALTDVNFRIKKEKILVDPTDNYSRITSSFVSSKYNEKK